MYEVAFDGFCRTPEEIQKCKNFWYRWNKHRIRVIKAIRYRRLDRSIIWAAIINRKLDFQ